MTPDTTAATITEIATSTTTEAITTTTTTTTTTANTNTYNIPYLLPTKPASFKPPELFPFQNSSNLFLLPLRRDEISYILTILNSQIYLLDSKDLRVVEEILVEGTIEAFKFDPLVPELIVKVTKDTNCAAVDNISTSDTFETVTLSATTLGSSTSTTYKSTNTSTNTSTNLSTNTSTITSSTTSTNDWFTVTCKSSSQSFNHPIISINFSSLQNISISTATGTTDVPQKHEQVLEVVLGDLVASISSKNQLQILKKMDRKFVLSFANLPTDFVDPKSLIWINDDIFIFNQFQILKYSLIQFSSPTNGCNWPLITWHQNIIHVHRAGAISPTWYKLKNSEVWDVLNSPIGNVENVQLSADGSCLLVCAENGVAFCDFMSRTWKSVPFTSLLHPKWLGNNHVVALTPDNKLLILISRDTENVMTIPVEDAEQVKFIDTYNNWQLLIQKPDIIEIFAFENDENNGNNFNFKLIKSIPVSLSLRLKQVAFLMETLFTLDDDFNFSSNGQIKVTDCKSFLILSTGHFLLLKTDQTVIIWSSIQNVTRIVAKNVVGILPFTNCLTVLCWDHQNFNLHFPLQSKFLLPDLFLETGTAVLTDWIEDPLYPLALEYILLESLDNPGLLATLDTFHQNFPGLFYKSIVNVTRKIEFNEAASKIFQNLPLTTPLKIVKYLPLEDNLNFLPLLAKSYHEHKQEQKEAILTILEALFNRRSYLNRIGKVKEYLSAFPDLDELFQCTLKMKIESLWNTGRLLKAFTLMQHLKSASDCGIVLDDVDEEENVLKIDLALTSVEIVSQFRSWLQTRNLPKVVDLLNRISIS